MNLENYETQEMPKDQALAFAQWFGNGINQYFDKEFDMNRAEGNAQARGFCFVFYNLSNEEIEAVQKWINSNCNNMK